MGRLYIKAQGCVPVLLENLHGMSCSGTCWPLGGASFQCRYGGILMSFYRLMFPGVRSSQVFSQFGLKPPGLVFSLILTVASRFLHLLSKTMGCLSGCLVSSASVQRLFCGICSAFKYSFHEFVGGRKWSPCPIPPPSYNRLPAYLF